MGELASHQGMSQFSTQRLPGPFGPVRDLLPKEQVVERVRHDEAVGSAIERMADHEYSQLPVERDGQVIGLFSWRSVGKKVGSHLTASSLKELLVEACLVDAQFISPEAFIDTGIDWTEVDCVLVGSPGEVLGLLAIYDVVGRLQDFGEAFFLIHETEHLLRTMIAEAVGDERHQRAGYGDRSARIVGDLVRDDLDIVLEELHQAVCLQPVE